jgi:hypothetical protein
VKVIASHASVPAAGEIKNGDRAVIRQEADCTVLSVIDGLGHGPGADAVSEAAAHFLMSVDLSWSTQRIIEAMHHPRRRCGRLYHQKQQSICVRCGQRGAPHRFHSTAFGRITRRFGGSSCQI